jgi:hypothetical protein
MKWRLAFAMVAALDYPDPINQLPKQEITIPQVVNGESFVILCADKSGDSLTRVQNACESHHVSPAVLIELFVISGMSLVRGGILTCLNIAGSCPLAGRAGLLFL